MPAKKLRALTKLSLRKSNKVGTKLYNEWHIWEKGTVFEPPAHMMVDLALKRGIAEEV
jgi:hypothetical protein